MTWVLIIAVLSLATLFAIDHQLSSPAYKGPKSDHFNGRNFLNPGDLKRHHPRNPFDMIKWALTGDRGKWTEIDEHDACFSIPDETLSDPSETVITFINHSTFLIQLNGLNILTDPVWSDRVSPYTWVGPQRMRPPGVKFNKLPPVDIVLISHNHYDHLDLPTVKKLKVEHDPLFIIPLGVDLYLNKKGITRTKNLDWWQQVDINTNVTLTGMPARHFSGRGVFDRDQTLWCGFMLETPHHTIYVAGDSAYGNFFSEIGNQFDIDLSIIPIGAYEPRWFMQPIHSNPAEAVKIHQKVKSSNSIASHFGTFPLGDEAMADPPFDLSRALKKAGVSSDEFQVLEEGKSFKYKASKLKDEPSIKREVKNI